MPNLKIGNKLIKNLEKLFILAVFIPILYLGNSWYQAKLFKDSPLSQGIQDRIKERETQVLDLIRQHYELRINIPLIVSDEFSSQLYGLTSYENGDIKIYLNKKRFRESTDYMIDEVIPHEYAHAIVFALGERRTKDGHTQAWQEICRKLDGKNCERYVDGEEIVRQKMRFK